MRIAIVLTPPTDQHFQWAAQIGVTDFVARYQWANSYDKLKETCERSESFGLKTTVVEGYLPIDSVIHAGGKRDDDIVEIQRLIENMGKLDVGILCYNFMPSSDWTRTALNVPARGGALTNGFNEAALEPRKAGAVTPGADQLWGNLEYFLKQVLPVAEANGIRLAMHPDDPPLAALRGADQIIHSIASYDRLFEISDSPSNTMCFCQGTFAEMGVDIPSTIARFGPKISYAHFRDVEGTAGNFVETFHDNGKTDMYAAMQAYADAGFTGAMRPDHVPTLSGEEGDGGGYTMLGRLFAVGYMRGLMHAVNSSAHAPGVR